jgi:hypothetical protein
MKAEFLLQGVEQKLIKHTLENKVVIYYTVYCYNIFTMKEKQNDTKNNNNLITLHKASQLSSEEENNSQISFLDLNLATRQRTLIWIRTGSQQQEIK